MQASNQIFIQELLIVFSAAGNYNEADAMSKYMRKRFSFFGIKSELRKSLQKDFLSKYPLPQGDELKELIEKLWALPKRELHYFAIEILEKSIKKADESCMPLSI